MRMLYTEASPGWGGQEIRVLREAEGMRARGHEVIFAVQQGGKLIAHAKESGFVVEEIPFRWGRGLQAFGRLMRLIRERRISLVNTHSSLDAWIGGAAGKCSGCRVVRTRHLSTPIRKGWNSRLLYNWLADAVVTTCAAVVPMIRRQAGLSKERCLSIPTGVDPKQMVVDPKEVAAFRARHGIAPSDVVAGTLCVLRGWKGVSDLLLAAKQLAHVPHLKWLIIGGGVSEEHFRAEWKALGLEGQVIFTGHIDPPRVALAALDIFVLLSWAHEGVSQASLQAGWLSKPLVTTPVGGLKEVCLDGYTGVQVSPRAPREVAEAVLRLVHAPEERRRMGEAAHALVASRFTLEQMLDQMEQTYKNLF